MRNMGFERSSASCNSLPYIDNANDIEISSGLFDCLYVNRISDVMVQSLQNVEKVNGKRFSFSVSEISSSSELSGMGSKGGGSMMPSM